MARSMVSVGTEASRAFWYMLRRVALALMSPPPSRAAHSSWRMSLANNLPRALSCAPFLCLMVAHFECPDIRSIASDGSQEQVVQAVLTCDLRVERGHEHRALAAHDRTA